MERVTFKKEIWLKSSDLMRDFLSIVSIKRNIASLVTFTFASRNLQSYVGSSK